ncbi:T9SS type B sorting domain-containing protein [Portibacter marinus]|uniref:T9SS type B sorting domain-containing protein n=1 Tax=Portibacter marinus TaxID=2898660 RepID=UPI001F2EA255|nr:gliding motility-associated C-terminal domain-containing protein [Portibacter marinus]
MNLRGICWGVLVMLCVGSLNGQRAEEVKGLVRDVQSAFRACPENAGVINMIDFDGQSNSTVFPGPIYLCYQDKFTIEQQGPFDPDCNDPDPLTIPGIGYAFYKCQPDPAITGPSITNVTSDNCLEDNPPPTVMNGFYSYRDKINGDALFFNEGQIQDFFNNGDPESMWFAPITFDNFAGNVVIEQTGSAVDVSSDQAFEVIYLNEVVISNKQIGVGGNPLAGSFQISGGVAEWDQLQGTPSDYKDIGIYKLGAINVRGTIQGGSYTHGDVVNFTVPEEGEYVIYVEDEKSCGTSMLVNFTDMQGTMTINIGSFTDMPGGNQCVSFCVEDFIDINTIQFTINFDPNYLTFDVLQNFNLFGLSASNFEDSDAENGILRFTWFDQETVGKTLANGECIFDVCFDVNNDSPLGGCSDIAISGNVVPISVSQQDPDDVTNTFSIDLIQNPGQACIDPGSNLTALINTCNAASGSFSGSVTFQVFGGSGPYSYVLDGPLSGPVSGSGLQAGEEIFIGNLSPGNGNLLTITDNDGNTFMQTVSIGNGNPLIIDVVGMDPSCFNFSNGQVRANVVGGTSFPDGSYMYEWSNAIFNAESIDGLTAGSYSVTVTDANGCEVEATEYIGKDPIDVQLDVTTLPTCISSNDGTATATITGGTPNASGDYNVRWEGDNMPTAFDVGEMVTNNRIQGGLFSVVVTDNNNCIWEEFFEVGAQKELMARFDYDQNVLCAGDQEAIFRVYGEYADGAPFDLDGANSPVEPMGTQKANGPDHVFFNGLGEGTYSLTLTDEVTGCQVDTTFTIFAPEELILNASAIFSCTSTTGGEILLSATGGTPNYTYQWADGSTEEDRSNLNEGSYAVTLTDGNGCQDSFSVDLMMGASVSIDAFIVEPISCEPGATGSIQTETSGEIGNISFSWEGPGGPYNTKDLAGLGPGTYYLTVTDDQGCMSNDSVMLVQGEVFTFDVTASPPSCTNTPDGSLAITINDPGTYTYQWAHPNNNNTEILSNIPAGDYFVTITQEGGCSQIDTLTLDSPASIDIAITDRSPTLCSYTNDGSVTVMASGGVVDNGNYGFFWSSGEADAIAANTSSTASMLSSGIQYVVVVDEMCFDTLFFEVEAPDSLMLNMDGTQITNATCFGDGDGSATLVSMGGTPGYLYFWPDDNIDDATNTGLNAGFHRFVLADANGCLTIDSILIEQPDSLIAEVDASRTMNIGCGSDDDGLIAIQVSGGDEVNGYTYQWSGDISNSDIASNLSPGMYEITVTDVNGCIDSTSYELTSPQPITAEIPTPEDPICFGDQTCIGINSVAGGSGSGYRFSINNGPLFAIDSCVNVFAGVYEIAIFDNTGCSFDTSLIIEQPEELILNLGPDIQVDLGDSTTVIDIAIEGPNPIIDVNWEPNTDFGCLNDDCSRIAVFPNVTTLYNVSVMDNQGCMAEDEILVEVVKIVRAYFPNAFSPDGNGINDVFNAYTGRGIQSIDEFRVFDRWGNEMYGIRNLQPNNGGTEGWDGRANGREVDSGVYAYFARITLIDNEKVIVRGDVTLLR